MKEQPSEGVLGIPQAFLTWPGACHYCKHDVPTPWGSALLWQFFPNDSGYETRFVIPLTSDLYSFFFFFFGVLMLYNDTLVSAVQWRKFLLSFKFKLEYNWSIIALHTQTLLAITTLYNRYNPYPHFTDEENEAQRNQVIHWTSGSGRARTQNRQCGKRAGENTIERICDDRKSPVT